MIGSSSMMSTSVAIWLAISSPALSRSSRNAWPSSPRIVAASAFENPSTAVSRKAWRGMGVIASRWRCAARPTSASFSSRLTDTEFQMRENTK